LTIVRIVILSRQASLYSTRRLAQVAEQRGHKPEIVDPLSYTIELNPLSAPGEQGTDPTPTAVIPRIGVSITEFGCAVVRQYEQWGAWTLNPAIGIARSRDKLLSMQLLHGRRIPVPRTAMVGQSRGLEQAIEAVGGLPVVLKLRRGTQGRGVVLAFSQLAARRAFAVLSGFQQYTLVQEYVAEARNRDIRVIIVGQEAVAAMEREAAPGDFRANLHLGGTARSFPLDDGIRELAVKAAQVHELSFCGVDLLMTKNGPAVIEVNSSAGLQGIETVTGVDVALAVIRHVETTLGTSTGQKESDDA
jgi:ribosomal protein S6--L-glutamate ligase